MFFRFSHRLLRADDIHIVAKKKKRLTSIYWCPHLSCQQTTDRWWICNEMWRHLWVLRRMRDYHAIAILYGTNAPSVVPVLYLMRRMSYRPSFLLSCSCVCSVDGIWITHTHTALIQCTSGCSKLLWFVSSFSLINTLYMILLAQLSMIFPVFRFSSLSKRKLFQFSVIPTLNWSQPSICLLCSALVAVRWWSPVA